MKRILPCVAAGLVALLSGCNPQTNNPFALFGQPTIPPPGTIAATGGNDYYPGPAVTLPATASAVSPATISPTAVSPATAATSGAPSTSAAGISVGAAALPAFQPARSSEAAIRIVENPNPTLRTAAIAPRHGTIEAVPAASSSTSPSTSPSTSSTTGAAAGDGLLEITRLPGTRGRLAPLPTTPASNRTRGFIPAVPQSEATPKNVPSAVPVRPRYSTGEPPARYDSAVAPATYTEPAPSATGTWHQR